MHFANPDDREALDALAHIKRLRARFHEEVPHSVEARQIVEEMAVEAERLLRAVERTADEPPPT